MRLGPIVRGIATFIPGMAALTNRGTGGTDSARYCYSVWLRHLVMSRESQLCSQVPRVVAELGPGESIAIGLAALLSGAERYYGLDVVALADLRRNLAVLDDLASLFRKGERIPDETEFPGVYPRVTSYDFPRDVVRFNEQRVDEIRNAINHPNGSMIRYVAPWQTVEAIERGSVDMIFSQAVLEHIDDLDATYAAMRAWLAPNGWLSHQIDFGCHGTAHEWNGHWEYEDWLWRMIRGRRSFFINRVPHSAHVEMLRHHGFSVVLNRTIQAAPFDRSALADRFRALSESDLTTRGAFIQAVVTAQTTHSRSNDGASA